MGDGFGCEVRRYAIPDISRSESAPGDTPSDKITNPIPQRGLPDEKDPGGRDGPRM